MTSIIERIQKRKTIDMILDVEFPLATKELVFKVARFSQAEQDQALFKAEGILKERGVNRESLTPEEYQNELNSAYYYSLADFVKRHVKAWIHNTEGEKLVFNAANLESLFLEFSISERVEIGVSYLLAAYNDNKKKEIESNSEGDSKKL